MVKPVHDERTEQHLAARIVDPFLFAQSRLQSRALRFKFRQPLFEWICVPSVGSPFRLTAGIIASTIAHYPGFLWVWLFN